MEEQRRTDDLYHYGIPGMRWGVRRYQNKNGSLTSEGKKRRSIGETVKTYRVAKKRKAALAKARETRAANKAAAIQREKDIKSGKIKAKDMTEAELKQRIDRLDLEKNYNDAMKNSKHSSRGNRFVEKFKDSTIDKLADNVGADLLAQVVKEMGARAINKGFKETIVYANNKKKS